MAKIIAICNQKGGVAKTTTAVNLSTYLALENKKTLLLDLDPQANATSGVGIDKHSIKKSIYNVLHEQITISEIMLKTAVEQLTLVPSSLDLTGAEVELVNAMSREYRLKKSLSVIRDAYDFVIIDCPPSLGLLTINALSAADSILVPIQCEYYALEGLSQLMNTYKLVRDNLNVSLQIEGVLMTMADYRTRLTKEVIDEVKKHFGDKVYKTVIPRAVKLTEAPGFGKPIALYDKHSIGARSYHDLAREVLGIFIQHTDIQEVIEEKEQPHGEEVR
ncbi:MAG: AAA family ATPase [Candidatus Omnitrophica bacterium]|nr:AAA family ATPase [Candidatus Omnitrophota bacterium]